MQIPRSIKAIALVAALSVPLAACSDDEDDGWTRRRACTRTRSPTMVTARGAGW